MKTKLLSVCLLVLLNACAKKTAPEPTPVVETKPIESSVQDEVSVPSVADVQKALNKRGAKIKVDGRMGPTTKQAVKSFQAKNKLKATGIADEETLKKLGLM